MNPATSLASRAILLLWVVIGTFGCDRASKPSGPEFVAARPPSQGPVYVFAVHPLHNPKKMHGVYQPLVVHLNRRLIGARLELEASRDYAHFESKIRSSSPHFLLPNPWQTLQAMKAGYCVIAQAGAPEDFKGIFIVRRDSDLRKPSDLKGKAVSYPSRTALAACIMPQYFLHTKGIDIRSDIENRYVGSQESSIMNVALRQTAAGATWPPPWRTFQKDHPREAAELKVLWETPPLISNSVMVRSDVPAAVREEIRAALLRLHESEEGRAILVGMETKGFYAASDGDYEIVRRYVSRFEKDVRPVEGN